MSGNLFFDGDSWSIGDNLYMNTYYNPTMGKYLTELKYKPKFGYGMGTVEQVEKQQALYNDLMKSCIFNINATNKKEEDTMRINYEPTPINSIELSYDYYGTLKVSESPGGALKLTQNGYSIMIPKDKTLQFYDAVKTFAKSKGWIQE